LTQVITQSDDIVRNRRLSELSGRRTKIVEALQQVTTAEYREALIRLLSQVERERLFGSVDIHYGFRIVDPLTQSDKPVDPNRFFSVAIGLFVGFALSAIFLIYWFLRVTLVPSVQSDHD